MGKWNYRRTWRPKNYYRDQRIPSPPTYYDTEFKFRGAWKNVDIPWEERFCISVGIPWKKIVNAKKYMHSYDNVMKWNDSTAKTTFHNAKKRFWAQINNIPTDDPQPDPDMYDEEIDWNPNIDLELIKDLDQAYFNPEDAKIETYNAIIRNDGFAPGCILGLEDNKNGNYGWHCPNKIENNNISDPWERGITQDDRKDAWGRGGNNSWQKDWGEGEIVNNSWHWNQFNRVPSQQTGQWHGQHNGQSGQRDDGSGWGSNVGCRKREGCQQHTTSYKSAKVQYDDYREGNRYRR